MKLARVYHDAQGNFSLLTDEIHGYIVRGEWWPNC